MTLAGGLRKDVRMGTRIATNLTLPKDLVDELDAVCGPRNRSAFVEEAVRTKLKREKMRRAWSQAAGILKAEDYPHWATPELVAQWVRDSRAEETDPGPEV